MGWFRPKKNKQGKIKNLKKLAKGKRALCTTCHKWYDPTNKRQFKKHGH